MSRIEIIGIYYNSKNEPSAFKIGEPDILTFNNMIKRIEIDGDEFFIRTRDKESTFKIKNSKIVSPTKEELCKIRKF